MSSSKMTTDGWLKAELHAHCDVDPDDYRSCSYTAEGLISEAARMGYQVLAITCHNRDIWSRELSKYAEALGITLIPGMEVSTEGRRHVLAYNFQTDVENLDSLEKIRARRREDTLVIAPHSFFPTRSCLRKLLLSNLDVFDAIEISGFHTATLDFNRRAMRIAREYGKPMVGNGDVHMLWQLGKTFTWINSAPGVVPVLQAIREGRVRIVSMSLSLPQVMNWWATTLWRYAFPANPRPSSREFIPSPASLVKDFQLTIDD